MEAKSYIFDFEKLDVYNKALAFSNIVYALTSSFNHRFQSSLGDQFRRAALSICNNIAEGSRKRSRGKKLYYDYALDSARECIPMITISTQQGQIAESDAQKLREKCVIICMMLFKLGQSANLAHDT